MSEKEIHLRIDNFEKSLNDFKLDVTKDVSTIKNDIQYIKENIGRKDGFISNILLTVGGYILTTGAGALIYHILVK